MKKFTTIFLSAIVALNLYADSTSCDTLNKSIDNLETSVTNQQQLVSKLSDDIGVMADRINTMADKIGTMADRIVTTEKLLSDTLLTLTGNKSLTSSVILKKPLDSTTASKATAPDIELSDSASTYLLYASKDTKFQRDNSIIIYIDSSSTLSNAWQQVANLASSNSDVVYIAVKSINNDVVSALSNSVKLTLQ